MNTKLSYLSALAVLVMTATVQDAKSQFWLTAGNNVGDDQKLGSVNNRSLLIVTNKVRRVLIDSLGHFTFGLDTGPSKFFQFGTSAWLKYPKDQYIFRHSNSQEGLYGNYTLRRMEYRDSISQPTMWMEWTTRGNSYFKGNMGIGTTTPEGKLHVLKGTAGTVTGFVDAPLIVENSTHCYMNLLAPSTRETGVLFGNPSSNVSGGITYNNPGVPNGLQFRTNGNATKMVITHSGKVGIGNQVPGSFQLKVSHSSFGLNLENISSLEDWELFVNSSALNLFCNGVFKGSFNRTNGAYTSVSDERLKTNVRAMPSVLAKIKQLKPSAYRFTSGGKEELGFIAQDVLSVFPSLVAHNTDKERGLDAYTLDYSGFGTIAIKGIQELQQTVEEQKETIKTLQERLTKLEAKMAGGNGSTTTAPAGTEIALFNDLLEQSQPNPVTSTAAIRYNIPAAAKNAQLTITDYAGKTIKQISLNAGTGVVNMDASALANGIYHYSLVINGKVMETKKMVVAR